MKTKRDLIDNNSESIVWHSAEKRVIEQLMETYASQFTLPIDTDKLREDK